MLKDRIGSIINNVPLLRNTLDHHMTEVVIGAGIALILRLVGAAAQFGYNILMARMLGAEGLGIFILAFTVSSFTSMVGRFGMDQAVMRSIAVRANDRERSSLKEVYLKGLGIVFLASSVAALSLFLLAPWLSGTVFHNAELSKPLQWMAVSVVPFGILNLAAESLRGLKLVHYSSLVQVILVPAIGAALFYGMVSAGLGVSGAVASYVLSTIIVMAIGLLICWRSGLGKGGGIIEEYVPVRELLNVSIPLAWVAIMTYVLSAADTLILSMFRPAHEVGIYTAALRLAMFVSFIPVAVNSILAPKFAALYSENDLVLLEQLARRSGKITLFLAGPFLCVFIFAPGFVMRVYGGEFVSGAVPLILVSLGQLINAAAGSVGLLLAMTDKQNEFKNIMVASALLNIILCFALIPVMGMYGAAIANAIPLIIANVAATVKVQRQLKISASPLWRLSKAHE